MANNNDKKSVIMGMTGALCWSFLGVFSKQSTIDPWLVIGIRTFVTSFLIGILRRSFKVPFTKGNFIGAAGIAGTCILYMLAIRMTSAANAIALQYAMTGVVLVVIAVQNRKFPSKRELFTVIGVFTGVMLCSVKGIGGGGSAGDILAAFSAVTFALVFLAGKRADADPLAFTYLGNLMCIPLMLLAKDFSMSFEQLGISLMIGLMNVTGYILMGLAMRHLSSVTSAVLANVDPVLNPVWVFLFLGEWPGWFSVAGSVLVLTTIIYYQCTQGKEELRNQNAQPK